MPTHEKKIQPRPQSYHFLRFGEIKPAGWMRTQMSHELEHGFVGHLDELVPELIRRDDIYGANRLTKVDRTKDLGVIAKETRWEVQFLWWNSETQSNWLDGMARTAMLLEQPDFIEKARLRVRHLLDTQDDDGYLGIYAPDLRFNFTGENGELWAQASLLRALLGWYEATDDTHVLIAVRRALDVTMNAYPAGRSHPFAVKDDFAGVGHGLVFADVLDRLFQLTGEEKYLRYALWLYEEYSAQPLSQDDIQITNLLDPQVRFRSHGVHTYEHLRALITAAYAADDPQLDDALIAALTKLETCLTPSGGPIGDEFIAGRHADASDTGYEYCSIHELLDSYTHLLQKTGGAHWADDAEWLLFNAGQGARHPVDSAKQGIAYLKTDNSSSMTGPLHPNDPQDERNPQMRYKYSPVHQDVAVCCVPNAGRILPYYIKSMWLRSDRGLAAILYGACDLRTRINDVDVHITETTDYPFDLEIKFSVETSEPTEFTLGFRRPKWATSVHVNVAERVVERSGFIHIQKVWKTGDIVTVRFETDVKVHQFKDESFISYGPLLFALPMESESTPGREYAPGFQDSYYSLTDPYVALCLPERPAFIRGQIASDSPWMSIALEGKLFDPAIQQMKAVQLLPLGATLLRQVTFKKAHIGDAS